MNESGLSLNFDQFQQQNKVFIVDLFRLSTGHMCMCYNCAIQQWRGIGGGHCPLCRAVIRDVIRTYKS